MVIHDGVEVEEDVRVGSEVVVGDDIGARFGRE